MEGDNWRGARSPAPFPVVTCSLAGVSRGGRPLSALSPHAVAHAGSSAGPHAPEAAGWSTAPHSCPGQRRPGSTAPAARHRALPDLPPGVRSAPAPASPQTLRMRGEREVADSPAQSQVAGPGGPATVPGRRTAPLEGRRGGGHRRSYTRLTPDSRLGRPPSLSLTCLAPPPPGPLPASGSRCGRWAAGRRYARDRRHRPLVPGLIFSLVSPRVRTAPRPHPVRYPPRRRSPG